jgi:hypothetical protein
VVAEQRSHRCIEQLLELLHGGELAAQLEMVEVALRVCAYAAARQGAAPRCWRQGIAVTEPLQCMAEAGDGVMVQSGLPADQRQLPLQDCGQRFRSWMTWLCVGPLSVVLKLGLH